MTSHIPLTRLFVASLLLFFPLLLRAEVINDFASQPENSLQVDTPNAFPGSAGEGWRGPWEGRRYLPENAKGKKYQVTLDGVSVMERAGKRYLKVGPWAEGSDFGAGVARAYSAFGELDLTKPYTISCTVLFERLPKGKGRDIRSQFFFIGENPSSAVGMTSGTSWFIQAFYGRKAGESVVAKDPGHRLHSALQRQWNVANSVGESEFAFIPASIAIKEGIEYQLVISLDPASSTYVCEITGGNDHYVSEALKFDSSHPLGRNIVIGSRHSQDDPAIFQVGDIRISKK